MKSTEKLLKCIVCQKSIGTLVKSICPKGHIHCHECSISLDGACGLCELPMESIEKAEPNNAKDTLNHKKPTIKSNQQKQQGKAKAKTKLKIEVKSHVHSKTDENFAEKCGDVVASTPRKAKSLENLLADEPNLNQQINEALGIKLPPSTAVEEITADVVGTALFNTLKLLHKSTCQRKCETFDICMHNLLLRLIDESDVVVGVCSVTTTNTATAGAEAHSIKGTESLTDLLETLHVRLCKENCDDMECCLNQQLENIIKKYKTIKTMEEQTSSEQTSEPEIVEKFEASNSNVARSIYKRHLNNLKPPNAQFELVKEFPKSLETQKPPNTTDDIELLLSKSLTIDEVEQIQCPLPNCSMLFDITKALSHLEDQHKNLQIDLLALGDCKTFFIDPSILDLHETICLLSYFVPNIFKSHQERAGLPIFILICRTNLSKLYAVPDEQVQEEQLDASSISTQNSKISNSIAAQALEAEIEAAIYGSNKKFKHKPVVWSSEDVLIVWPIAPIPTLTSVKTVLSVFLHNKPICQRTVSFLMRSLEHSRDHSDVFGAPDALTLTNVEIEALTNHGQHAIQCQIMCDI